MAARTSPSLEAAISGAIVRAVGIEAPGDLDVVGVVDRPVREPAPGEVRIAVAAAAVNPTDIGLRRRGVDDLPPPWTPGMDAAGVVEAVGEGVERLAAGDEVMAAVTPRRPDGGAQAELLVAPAASVVPIPDGVTLGQAATLPMNGLTALLGLELLDLEPGGTLAVSGGAGQLASYVIPIAKGRGLEVIADAKPEDEELVRSFGADEVIPRRGRFAREVREVATDGVDAVFDTALLHGDALGAIRDGGGIAAVRRWDGSPTERGIRIHEVLVVDVLERTDWLEELRGLASQGRLALRVAAEYPPDQAAEAQRVMDAGGLRGRALIVF